MTAETDEISQSIQHVRDRFPFKGYMDNKQQEYRVIVSRVLRICPRGSRILSIGSGPCDVEAVLARLGYNLTGVDDLNDPWHLIGKNRERILAFAKEMNVNLLVGEANRPLATSDLGFDAVMLNNIVEHLHESPRELLNYSIKLLRKGGTLLIVTPNAAALVKRLKLIFGKSSQSLGLFYWNIGTYRGHVREYTSREVRQILSYHQLDRIEASTHSILLEDQKVIGQRLLGKFIAGAYGLVCIYPGFRDTIVISGIKPETWVPTAPSLVNYEEFYAKVSPLPLSNYNIDNESDETLLEEFQGN